MSEINLPPFYVGQKVVAIKSAHHPKAPVFKDNQYACLDIWECHGCKRWYVAFAPLLPEDNANNAICICDIKHGKKGNYWYCCSSFFAPIVENFQSISLERVLEQETKLISVN